MKYLKQKRRLIKIYAYEFKIVLFPSYNYFVPAIDVSNFPGMNGHLHAFPYEYNSKGALFSGLTKLLSKIYANVEMCLLHWFTMVFLSITFKPKRFYYMHILWIVVEKYIIVWKILVLFKINNRSLLFDENVQINVFKCLNIVWWSIFYKIIFVFEFLFSRRILLSFLI